GEGRRERQSLPGAGAGRSHDGPNQWRQVVDGDGQRAGPRVALAAVYVDRDGVRAGFGIDVAQGERLVGAQRQWLDTRTVAIVDRGRECRPRGHERSGAAEGVVLVDGGVAAKVDRDRGETDHDPEPLG